ncbi:tyrosine-type recombinase/integrase [Cohnella algarum]|uniref:tyrosine-type recombinase/integrase n=1 Tax=Cohnella algarum TaxID=2044859 RepID=UPI00196813A5|nr:site-specific integrase [Cohnella algarum]MBN2980158.1 site-specific integrase [Cohnella algarum]
MKGSIEKRGEASWRLTVDVGTLPDGSRDRRRKTITVEDKALLKTTKKLKDYLDEQLADFKREIESGEYLKPQKMTFSEFVENEWKPKYAQDEDNLSPSSYEIYCGHLKNHILPRIGHFEIQTINTMKLVNMMSDIKKAGSRKDGKEKPLSPGTVRYIHRVAKNVFSRAAEWGLIKENPMNGVQKPSENQGAERFYDEDETQNVINKIYSHLPLKWRLYFVGAIVGGFRRGELTALQWPDVLLDQNAIRVAVSISIMRKGIAHVSGPKTEGSKAIVDMPEWYMNELRAYRAIWEKEREEVGDKWKGEDNEFVFHAGFGKPFYFTHPTKKWRDFCEKHGLKYVNLHGLRHTTATVLLENETDMKVIQQRLRHTQHSTTTGLYAHVTKKVSRVAASKFDKFNPLATQEDTNFVPNSSPTASEEHSSLPLQ